MNVVALDSTFSNPALLDGVNSVIWTDRYRLAGDFELTSANVEQILIKVRLGTVLRLLEDQTSWMIVESIEINQDKNKRDEITVKGRSLETIFEGRIARDFTSADTINLHKYVGDTNTLREWDDVPYRPLRSTPASLSQVAAQVARDSVRAATYYPGQISSRADFRCSVSAGTLTSNNDLVTNWEVKLGTAYERIVELLAIDNLGWKFTNFMGEKDPNSIDLLIYGGGDKSKTVVFDVKSGHLDKIKYFWTNRGKRSTTFVFGYDQYASHSGIKAGITTGMIEYVEAPEIKRGAGASQLTALKDRAKLGKGQTDIRTIVSATVSPNNPHRYNSDYKLGDLVTVAGDYGVREELQVTEFIRIRDEMGEREYPGLESLYINPD